jgi:phosphohistidine phosphatase SixA
MGSRRFQQASGEGLPDERNVPELCRSWTAAGGSRILVEVMTLRPLALLVVVSAFATGCRVTPPPPPPPPALPATSSVATCSAGKAVIVVRHAEKATTDKDTPLSERGQARARALATMLGNAGVTRLVATQYRRTQETLTPLSARVSLPIELRSADEPSALVSELRAAPDGSVTVVASHSNVVPRLVRELSGAKLQGVEGDSLAETDFGRVIVITLPCVPAHPFVLELSSGEP